MMDGVKKLLAGEALSREEFVYLLENRAHLQPMLTKKAEETCLANYGRDVYVRGLIEFTNYCRNDCYYCGIRRSNCYVNRFRLDEDTILERCAVGYGLGLRTFVLQGGEDGGYSPHRLANLVNAIKTRYPDCAVTLSVGEHPKEVYQSWFDAGADRYLLRHETASTSHYRHLHPERQSLQTRLECLENLKEIGYQVGCGFMVGSPGQGVAELAEDLFFIQRFRPHMVGIGPFLPQKDTPFRNEPSGDGELTLYLLSLVRLMLPRVLLPATTALATLLPKGREQGFLAGANVCMPNLSPEEARKNYTLYDNKLSTGTEAAESLQALNKSLQAIDRTLSLSRGDHIERTKPYV